MAKKKLHKLNLEYTPDFVLIGVASHENDYRLSWSLNNEFGFKFVKTDDLIVYNSKHKLEVSFSKYFLESKPELNAYLISNKSESGFLLPKHKNIDFIIKVNINEEMDFINSFINNIKKVDIVITAFILEDIPERLEKVFEF